MRRSALFIGGTDLRRGLLAVLFGVGSLGLVLAFPAMAQCPEGKEPVLIVLPNGNEKEICVPPEAGSGLDNAAENSGVVIACPCFTEADILEADAEPEGLGCVKRADGIRCGPGEPNPGTACDASRVAFCDDDTRTSFPPYFVAGTTTSPFCRSSFTWTDTFSVNPKSGALDFCPVQECDANFECVEVNAAEAENCLLLLEAVVDVDCTTK